MSVQNNKELSKFPPLFQLQKKKENNDPVKLVSKSTRMIGGMCGGFVEACALQPLDTLKTRLQLPSSRHQNVVQLGKGMVVEEGFLAFYKGLTPFVTHLVTKYALRFYSVEYYRHLLNNNTSNANQKLNGFIAGLGAGVTEAILIVTPFEVVKTRLQQQKGQVNLLYRNPVHCAKTILQNEGIRALWKGCVPTMTRQGLNQCFLFGSYDILKQSLWNVPRDGSLLPHQSLITGMVAGMLGPCVNCPVDVSKTRLMAQNNKIGEIPKYRGMVHCIQTVYKDEGISALYRGLLPRIARVAPGQGITFMVMEAVIKRID